MTSSNPGTSNPALAEELLSVNAIYPSPPALTVLSSPSTTPSFTDTTLVLAHPITPITFTLSVPAAYPAVPPTVTGTHSIGDRPRGEGAAAVQVLRETVTKVWHEGEVCLFDLLEEAAALLEPGDDGGGVMDEDNGESEDPGKEQEDRENESTPTAKEGLSKPDGDPTPRERAPGWMLSALITEKKSAFIAWAAPVTSKDQALRAIEHLLTTNKKVATSTHNITAYRIRDGAIVQQDYDDDGETAAGGRVLHLMQLMDVWNVVVVVSRWYGGVKLGPDRFRIINSVAREALVKGAFVRKEDEAGKGKSKGKK